ncbi:hypothetical protein ABZP36_020410 [Zizania latifolia]
MNGVSPSSNQQTPAPPPHVWIASTAVVLSIVFSTFIIVIMALAFYFCRLCRDRTRSDSDSDSGATRARLGGCSGVSSTEPFPVEILTAAFAYGGGSSDDGAAQCSVCLGTVQVGEMVRLLPACKHLYHVECIDMWLASHATCPLCRTEVELPTQALPPV